MNNEVIFNSAEFYISYNNKLTEHHLAEFLDFIAKMYSCKYVEQGIEETALVIIKDDQRVYKILNGDWRKEYKELAPNLNRCLEFFNKMKEDFGTPWSTLEEDIPERLLPLC